MQSEELKLIISNSPPFNKLNEEQIDKLIAISEIKEYQHRQVIYNQGDQPGFLFIVLKGRVAISVSSQKRDAEIEIIKRGTCFGVISLLTDEPHSVTARSMENSFLMQVAKKDFEIFLENNPYLALDFSRMLSQRVKARSKPKGIFKSKKIGIIGEAGSGKTTFMFNLAKQIKQETRKGIICIQIFTPLHPASDNGQVKSLCNGTGVTGFTGVSSSRDKDLALRNFSEDSLSGYIRPGEVDSLSLIADSGNNFLSLLNFLSERYHFVLYEIPYGFWEIGIDLFIEPAESLHFIIFPKRGVLKRAASLIKDLTKVNPLNKEKIKVILAEFPLQDHLSFAKKRSLLEHPIDLALPRCGSPDYEKVLRRLARRIGEVTIGVALGSGAAYGYAHIGVLEVLEEAGIPVDIICGSSMGAVIAALWAVGFSFSAIENYAGEVGRRIGSFSLFGISLPLKGIMTAKRLENIFKRIFKELTFYDLKHTLKVVAFEFSQRQAVVLEEGLIYKALAASCAFPGIFEPVHFRKDILMDGGVLNPLPTKVLLQYNAHKIIAANISLSQEQARCEYAKKNRFRIFDFIFGSIETMQQEFIQQAMELADVTIHVNLEGLGWTDFDKKEEFIKRGRIAARGRIEEIKKLTASR